eukprot:354064-Chlamydomonas_euryale.AAC.2
MSLSCSPGGPANRCTAGVLRVYCRCNAGVLQVVSAACIHGDRGCSGCAGHASDAGHANDSAHAMSAFTDSMTSAVVLGLKEQAGLCEQQRRVPVHVFASIGCCLREGLSTPAVNAVNARRLHARRGAARPRCAHPGHAHTSTPGVPTRAHT